MLHKAFENHTRIHILAALISSGEWVDFGTLKNKLGVSDGNLAAHIVFLEKEAFITIKKQTIDKRPNTSYQITPLGRRSAKEFLRSLDLLFDR